VISANTDRGTAADAEDVGATFVPKPLDLDVVSRLIRDHEASA
jgi:hypothetical protein